MMREILQLFIFPFLLFKEVLRENDGKVPVGILNEGDLVVVSLDNHGGDMDGTLHQQQHYGLAIASVIFVNESLIVLLSDKHLKEMRRQGDTEKHVNRFRLDKYESLAVHSINLSNVTRLLSLSPKSQRLRELIIDGVAPRFESALSSSLLQTVRPYLIGLNNVQMRAIIRVLLAEDYSLIQGLPGSGKTSTIAALIRILVALNASVLITAYTHSAVDNVLLKLSQLESGSYMSENCLRIGSKSSIHPDCLKFTMDSKLTAASGESSSHTDDEKAIVAMTCLQATSVIPLLSKRDRNKSELLKKGSDEPNQPAFDVCILDEATQCLLPASLTPVSLARKFVLVGDDKQLNPLVLSKEAREEGMSESLFSLLKPTASAAAIVTLDKQYRMNREICRLSSDLFYGKQLACASEEVAGRRFQYDGMKKTPEAGDDSLWMNAVTSRDLVDSVVVLRTSRRLNPSTECQSAGPGLVYNTEEASIVLKICQSLKQIDVPSSDVGVISFYRYQTKHIKSLLETELADYPIEVNTADKFQGRDKAVIIVSFAWTDSSQSQEQSGGSSRQQADDDDALNKNQDVGVKASSLFNELRVNVSLTRAKEKLILIGDVDGLAKHHPILQRLFDLIQPRQIRDLD